MANIIFDFDGTIADSFGTVVEIFEQVMRRGEPVSAEEIERLRSMSLIHAALELKIRPWRMPFLLAKGRRLMRQRINTVGVFDGVPELIQQLEADGHKLYVVSSNSVQNIRGALKRYGLRKEFIKLYGGAGLFGKTNLLRRVLASQKLDLDSTIYVGDEVRDIEAAKKSGIRIIAVTWGYNNEAALRAHEPDFIAQKVTDIAKIIAAQA
jgi:phosphoglycolate phosphatase-like HAD superfamily hydrolase